MLQRIGIRSLFLLYPFLFSAQTYHFANYSVKDGLAQSNVAGVIQDSSGFYWIATEGGVSRFDGRNFVNYTVENGLSDNNVSAIFLDKKNYIWLGHENGSLTRYDGKNFVQISSRLLPKDKKIYGFFQDRTGNLWISTASEGAIKIIDPWRELDTKTNLHIKVYSGRDGLSQYVISVAEDSAGNIWFLTDIGIKIYYKTTHRFEFFRPEGMPVGQISCLATDKDQNILLGTISGSVSRYNTATGIFENILKPGEPSMRAEGAGPNFIYAILEDSKGNIWASASNKGVFRYEKTSSDVTLFNMSNGLSVNKIKNIFEDREGNIIFSTYGEGINIFSGERFVSFSKRNGLVDNQVWAVCSDQQGRYWFGTNAGITVYDPGQPAEKAYRNITVKDNLLSNNIRAIVADRAGNLWIGTWGGKVQKYDQARNVMVQVPALNEIVNNLVSSLLIDKNNRLWIGTYEGVVVYDISSQKISTYRTIDGLSDNDISCMFEDHSGNIWLGTKQKGLNMFNGKEFVQFNRQNGLTYNSISSVAEDKQHQIWIGTEGGGVFVYNGKEFKNHKVKNGLLSDFITLLTVDANGDVWLGTNKGINRYLSGQEKFTAYLAGDGFTGVETKPRAVYNDAKGNIWFGTVNGAYKYDPVKDIPVIREPVTKILQFRVNLNEYPVKEFTELSYQENSLIFDFVGISLSNPEGVSYKIKLEGYDKDWKPVSRQTSEIYSNLPHGSYTFYLLACNSSGVCGDPELMHIKITPPFWKTWWFYLVVASAASGLLFLYIKIRERKLRHEKSILETKVNERTAEVVEKNKELDEINKDITASIRYAKRIQDAILPPEEYVRKLLPDTFVLFKPKDIVSGDFYWMEDKNDRVIFAAVDCTGHGVPGAFMSIVGHNLLDRVVAEQNISKPARILDELNKSITETLRQRDLEDNTVRDGMDIALCSFNKSSGVLEFAGAYNPLWLVRNNEVIEFKADKFPIGNSRSGDPKKFTNHEIPLRKGDSIYIFSDGFSDQFGGPHGKKFKSSALKQLLLNSQHLSMSEQCRLLDHTIEQWRGNHEQVDDILVIGTRYN